MAYDAATLGRELVAALNDPTSAGRAAQLRDLVAPGSTWWCDTGCDRVAGRWWRSPGAVPSSPLHGTLPMARKLELLEREDPSVPGPGRWTVLRSFAAAGTAILEVQSDCAAAGGMRYANRHAFVLEATDGRIVAVREYLDTLYAADMLGAGCRGERRVAPPPADVPPIAPAGRTEELALALWEPLAANDVDGFGAPFAPEGTWWTDTGAARALGAFERLNLPPLSYPLHGRIPIQAKLDAMRAGRSASPSRPSLRVTPLRLVSQDDLAALEAESYCELPSGRVYQNRYVFVFEAGAAGIREVREYADTLHIADVFIEPRPVGAGG